MEEEKERGIILVGSGTGKTTAHIINEIMAQQKCAVIVVDNQESEHIEEKVSKIKAPPLIEKYCIEVNQRGIIPPNYYKKKEENDRITKGCNSRKVD